MAKSKPKLRYSIRRDFLNGCFYATLITGSRPTDKRRFGPYESREAAKNAMNEEITTYLVNSIEGEIMADILENEIRKISDNCLNTACFSKKHPDAQLPFYSTEEAVGADLYAVVDGDYDIIDPGKRKLIKTGLVITNMDKEYELQIRPRSGLALKYGITCLNTPGTIDPDYRGEIGVILLNTGDIPFVIRTGDRIAQIVPAKRNKMFFAFDENITATRRGNGGFGSTGH